MNRTSGRSPFEVVYGRHPRGLCELRDLGALEMKSGQAEDFTQTIKEVQEQVKKAILESTQKLKVKIDEKRREVQFKVGDYVMVHLSKARIQSGKPTKLQMKRVGPCEILEKYGENAYKVDLPSDLAISPVFNVADLVMYKGEIAGQTRNQAKVLQDLDVNTLPQVKKPIAEEILETRVKKSTRHQVYMEHLVKSADQLVSEATWVEERKFKKLGIHPALTSSPIS